MKSLKLHLVLLLAGTLLYAKHTSAQKEKPVQQLKELPKSVAHITKEIEAQIIEIVKPVKDKIEQLFNEDATGNYKAYAEEMQKIGKITNAKLKYQQLQKFEKKYYPFIKGIWEMAKINDADYQQKLISLFPNKIRETIRFGEFLNFSMGSSNPLPPPPPPAPPAPANICIDANTMFRGTSGMESWAIGGAMVQVQPARPPSPAEIVTGADAITLGIFRSQGWLHNSIAIPATFPFDSKPVRSKKTFDWRGTGAAFSILGCAWSTVAYTTNPHSDDFSNGGEIYSVVAPITFLQTINKTASKTEESLIAKTDLRAIQFGISCYASASSSIILSWGNARSSCAMLKWSVCEE